MAAPDSNSTGMPLGPGGCHQTALIALTSSEDASAGGSAPQAEPSAAASAERAAAERAAAPRGRQGAAAERHVTIHWPDGRRSRELCGRDWLSAAHAAGQSIPTGCLGGSCGACEIEVNGQVVRACIARVPASRQGVLHVELASDPYW